MKGGRNDEARMTNDEMASEQPVYAFNSIRHSYFVIIQKPIATY
jgi:hypothetical protein